MSRNTSRLTYQPFLFVASIAALIAKVAYSLASRRDVFDMTLYAIVGIFVVGAVLYFVEHRRPVEPTDLRAEVSVKDVKNADVLGAEATKREKTSVKVNAGDVTGSRVTGYKEIKGK